jgi:hypothetical protein
MGAGFIRLSRKFFENEYWLKARSFSQAEAWLDLIQLSRFEAEPTKKILPNGRQISIERGEIHASLRYLSARWSWGSMQVRTFLRKAVLTHQITQRVTQGENIITLCKYDDYNPLISGNNTPNNTPNNKPITHRQHTDDTNNKKEKKEKKEKKKNISPNGDCETSVSLFGEETTSLKNKNINYQMIIDSFHSKCPSFSSVQTISDARKNKMKTRINEIRKQFKEPYNSVLDIIFIKMEGSKFLKGDNNLGWKATFDWVFKNGSNWVKVYEGNYDDRPLTGCQSKKNDFINKLKNGKNDTE